MTARDAMADPPDVERHPHPAAPTRASTGPDTPEGATGVPGARRAPARLPATLLVPLGVTVVVVAALYWAQAFFIPVALAIMLTFLLDPVVTMLERRGVPQLLAVAIVVVLGFSAFGGIGWGIARQVSSLVEELPQHQDNIRQKIRDMRGAQKGGTIEKADKAVQDVVEALNKPDKPVARKDEPVPVVVQKNEDATGLGKYPSWGTLAQRAAEVGLVLVLVIFMLLERTEMRDRVIRLFGYGRLTVTTKAMDEAGQRISRYLLMQSIINASFGTGIGLGLFLIGVPYALLWGFLAALLRFIPYVGPWLGAGLPIALSLVVFPGWQRPLLVVGLFVVLELFSNMVLETWLYGQSAGISQVALLIAIAFWTWLWGPVGLLLATPVTVCVVVLAKHVPAMEFIAVLMTDEPVLRPEVRFYQRLLAADEHEAADIVEEALEAGPIEEVYDTVLVPALTRTKADRAANRLTDDEHAFIVQATADILDEVAARGHGEADAAPGPGAAHAVLVLGVPALDETDELALRMLRHLLDASRRAMEVTSPHRLASEVVALVADRMPSVVCIGALPTVSLGTHSRYLCKRLRARYPDLRIIVGRWGATEDIEEVRSLLLAAGADQVTTTLAETRHQVELLASLEPGARLAANG